ncbi:MAG: hypothetical protein WCQ32_01960 [bacterium]
MARITQLPLCYRFSFNIETMTLSLIIQKWLMPELQKRLRAETLLMDYMYREYGGDKTVFASCGEQLSFGYENAIQFLFETDTEIAYGYTFTPVIEPTEEICDRCNGTKIDHFEHPCNDCRATGKKHVQSKRHFQQGMLSLCPIVRFLNGALLDNCTDKNDHDWKSETNEKQLIALEWTDTTGMHNCSISAWTDDFVFEWLKQASDIELQQMTYTMARVEEVLLRKDPDAYSRRLFRFDFYDGTHFGFQAPGNACTLGTSSYTSGMFGSIGKTLSPHNVDNRFQQIEFIVGLAVLNDLIIKSTVK